MEFNEFQKYALQTAVYPNQGSNITYPVLGLCGEAGEVAEKVKKVIRDKEGIIDQVDLEEIAKELGDVLWYVAATCRELNLDMDYPAELVIKKLQDRAARNQLHGQGDNR